MFNATNLFGTNVQPTQEKLDYYSHAVRSAIAAKAMARRVEAGECPGVAPFGYRNVIIKGHRTVEVDEAVAPLLIEAFRMAGRKDGSLRKILGELTPRGLTAKSGRTMGVSSLREILANPFYAGLIRWQGELHQGVHQPLVSKSLFLRVRSRLFRRRCRQFTQQVGGLHA